MYKKIIKKIDFEPKKIPEYFIKGLLFFVPLVVTISVLGFVFVKIDSLLGIPIRGMGFLVTALIIIAAGYLTTNIFTRSIINIVDQIFSNIPFIKLIYNSVKDLVNAFIGKDKRFNKPVIVTIFPQSQAKALGFITTEDLEHFNIREHVVVYFPQSYNFAGQTLIFPKEHVKPIKDVASSELMTFIVSAGVAGRRDMLDSDTE